MDVLLQPVIAKPSGYIAQLAFSLLALSALAVSAQTYQGRELVRAELVADTSAVVAGKPFKVGLLLHMVPGWHTYWKFPGDAGIPTDVKWTLPAGWNVGEIRWPVPLKLEEPGDIQIYGYRDEVLLIQQVTPSNTAAESVLHLAAEASWLVCEKICIPGNAKLKLDLPFGPKSIPANRDLFDRFEKQLPRTWPNDSVARWSMTDNGARLVVESRDITRYRTIDFYPDPRPDVVVGHPVLESRETNSVTLRIPIESGNKSLSGLNGILVLGNDPDEAERTGWVVAAATPSSAWTKATREGHGLATLLFFGFLGGLILNLMPCVLPVISLKIFGFIRQAGQGRRSILHSGLAFTAGIFAWFIVLGVVVVALKSAGHQVSWALQFTNSYFVFGMSVLVLVFALNLFGVFEVSLPSGATQRMAELGDYEGEVGSFFQGVFATLLATPCTAPYLGTALGFAFSQSGLVIMAMFLAIALGMALPYLVLAAQPGWVRLLPRPGPWMNHLKQAMGFFLLATLVFLLYVIGAQRGLDGLIWTCAFLLIVSLVCWIKGVFVVPTASTGTRLVALVAMAVLLVTGAAYCIGAKFRASQPAIAAEATAGWQNFSSERLQSELQRGNPVFIDFTAAWCLNCKFNEAHVLEDPAVRAAFRDRKVTKLRADWTNGDPVITRFLQHFGRAGVPLYVLYAGNSEEPVVFPELLTKTLVLQKLEALSPRVAAQ